MLKKKQIIIFISCLLFVSLSTRFYFLFYGMPSLTHDEADFYFTGYTLAKTGHDQWGNSFFLTSGFLSAIPSTPVYISALFWKFFPIVSATTARLPFALINSFSPVLLFILVLSLSKNRTLSVLAFFVMNFSPWFMHLSATAGYDGTLLLFFALLSTNILLWNTKQKIIKFLLFFIVSFLGFNTYMGFKTVFPFFLFVQLLLLRQNSNQKVLLFGFLVKTVLICVFIFSFFLFLYFISPGSNLFIQRAQHESALKKSEIDREVWFAHYVSEGHPMVRRLFANKILAGGKLVLFHYLKTFEPNIFFVSGDPQTIYGLRITGFFFVLDLIFFIFGIMYCINRKCKPFIPVLLLFLIGGIPSAVASGGFTLSLRGMLLIIPYCILIGFGYYSIYQKKGIYKYIVLFVLFINVSTFLILYQTRIKVMSAEAWRFTDMKVISYLQNYENVHAFITEPHEFFLMHSLYNSVNDSHVTNQLLNRKRTSYSTKNLTVYSECKEITDVTKKSYILVDPVKCSLEIGTKEFKKNTVLMQNFISADKDNRTMFQLFRFIGKPS